MISLSLRVALILLAAYFICACYKRSSSGSYTGPSGSSSSNSSSSNSSTSDSSTPTGPGGGEHASQGNYSGFTRPPLVVQRGQFFSWAMPADWRANETGNGVDMISPDGKLIANAEMLQGSAGQTTPWNFLVNMLTQLRDTDINGISTQDLPSMPSGYPGIYWQIQEFDLTFTDATGVSRHADLTCGILNAYGGYSVILQGFSAPMNEYDQAKTWMPLLPQSVVVINAGQVAYQDQLIPVRNHPLDNSGLMESWAEKRLSQDRIAKAQHEGMMGYERMVSPTTGRYYNMPLETYDGTVAGYRNPDHPEEILNPTKP